MRLSRVVLILALLAALDAARASAQLPGFPPRNPAQPRLAGDTSRARRDSAGADTSKAGRGAGLPSRPSRAFQAPDSVTAALMQLRGFRVTRYAADSVQFLPPEKEIRMSGQALVARDGSTLQADTINYRESNCALQAAGSPQLFDQTGVMIGHGMLYDACNHAGLIGRATTDFKEDAAACRAGGRLRARGPLPGGSRPQ